MLWILIFLSRPVALSSIRLKSLLKNNYSKQEIMPLFRCFQVNRGNKNFLQTCISLFSGTGGIFYETSYMKMHSYQKEISSHIFHSDSLVKLNCFKPFFKTFRGKCFLCLFETFLRRKMVIVAKVWENLKTLIFKFRL